MRHGNLRRPSRTARARFLLLAFFLILGAGVLFFGSGAGRSSAFAGPPPEDCPEPTTSSQPSPEPTPSPSPSDGESSDEPAPDPAPEEPDTECTEDPDDLEDPDEHEDGNDSGPPRGRGGENEEEEVDRPHDRKSGRPRDENGSSGEGRGSRPPARKGSKGENGTGGGGTEPASPVFASYGDEFDATGEFGTDRLRLVAVQLRARGVPEEKIIERVYSPFIIGGPAAWTDTWGAPRYGPGPLVRTHEGQDVFCRYGDPVLATRSGTIEFDDGGLGGRVARLFAGDGSYFYYAHLSGWNTKSFENGDRVVAGDVIGYCGNTGNAITTPPHVHFGWYQANGKSRDPMPKLVGWLRAAERNAAVAFEKETGRSIAHLEQEATPRLLGDGFAPDISELEVSSETLLGTGQTSEAGAFTLVDAALQAALAGQPERVFDGEVSVESEGAGDMHSELADFLESEL